MASLFDQYNKTLKRESITAGYANNELPPSSGFVSVRTKEETPIFSKRKMNLTLFHDIVFLTVSNSWMVILLSNNNIFRLNLQQPEKRDDISLEKFISEVYQAKNIHLDQLGVHLFIPLVAKTPNLPAELLYLHRKWQRPKKIDKLRDHEITAIAFNPNNTQEHRTGSILFGTSRGLIFEADLQVDGDRLTQNVFKQVFDVSGGIEYCPITGIEFYSIKKFSNYVIVVTTKDRLYKFNEILDTVEDRTVLLQNVFTSYLNVAEQAKQFIEMNGLPNHSRLDVSYSIATKMPRGIGWLREPGLYYCEINPDVNTPESIVRNVIITYPEQDDVTKFQVNAKLMSPISFILSDFHVLLLYSDHVTAVSLLNNQKVYEEYFTEQFGKLLNITKDWTLGVVYVYTSKCIFRYNINNEQRNVWRMYIDKNEFELAKQYCADNPAHMDIVLVKQAELLFQSKEYAESALVYSKTQSSFEEVCLKFLDLDENEALMIYLTNRLEKTDFKDKTQITMLVVWMFELYLTGIARCVEPSRLQILKKEYDTFKEIPRVVECMKNNRTVIYDLMASRADNHNLTMLTKVNRDYESVLNQYINQDKFIEALNILKMQNKPDLYYKYCPILMEAVPKETISQIIEQSQHLDIIKLLPTLVSIESEVHVNEVVQYLEYSIYKLGCVELSIHNYVIKLYGKYQPNKMLPHLQFQGTDPTMVYYDINYALRVCNEHLLYEACIFLQCLLEMWLPAVELSLKFNIELAQKTASQPIDRNLRRTLWLKIAQYKIKDKDNVDEAIELMKECNLLKIEDLLPFFSDFQKIDNFKEIICEALKEYNIKINEQRKEMEESAKSAERVRTELQSFRNHSITISASEQCAICEVYLFIRPSFIFPCGHKFHSDCLEKQLVAVLPRSKTKDLFTLRQNLAALTIQHTTQQEGKNGSQSQTRDTIKSEIENILASDCLYCGDNMINTIDQPFIDDWANVNNGWD